ncbi:tumor necrosis factor ligand superfamily member 18 [Thunnus thynnus]|uniref:tumor necrosis factor ligand superfamily member 18 n=1 Tax=Thunnus thynnus TaxID=8237 RepID=UPI003529CA8A
MPQIIQHTLIHVLLLWTTILSIFQIVFIVLLFTGGHHAPLQFQNKSNAALGGSMPLQADSPTPSNNRPHWGSMITYVGSSVKNTTVSWKVKTTGSGLISEEGCNLTIKRDGYFFLTLQVTLSSCEEKKQMVKLKLKEKIILQGTINTNTCSTGLLGKVQGLSAGGELMVTIDPPSTSIVADEYLTHLDVIYMGTP